MPSHGRRPGHLPALPRLSRSAVRSLVIPTAGGSALLKLVMPPRERDLPQLLDVRSEEEFGTSHLPGAIRIDYRRPLSRGQAVVDPARPVVVYCSAGYRSSVVARKLRQAGFAEVLNLEGGIFAWGNAGLPLERDGRPASAVHPCLRLFSRMVKPRN